MILRPKPEISPIRRLWPLIFANGAHGMTFGFLIVMLAVSNMIWPSEPFDLHAAELGSIITIRTWVLAVSGMIVGRIVDLHNRKIQLVISTAIPGLAFIAVGFVPAGLGFLSFIGFF
ncbi:MAG: hypothetical protein RBG13Loki_4078 [Promethearchaeota archaeon CR_4]|nr:MAG: hypothetical protein RBG13Loki_4078 [Candidatus Lokiarchaeota archaeon CR_4]